MLIEIFFFLGSFLFFFCRGSIPCAESSETKCTNTRDEILQTEYSDSSNQERLDQYESCRLKSDLAPSTSKPDALTNHRKVEVGKKRQTYSGPLAQSGMPTTSVSERVHSTERLIFSFLNVFFFLMLYKVDALTQVSHSF